MIEPLYDKSVPDKEFLLDFCKYTQPIVTGCAGFIRTDGYVLHTPGLLLFMSYDECFFSIVRIPVIYNIIFISSIRKFLANKEDEDRMNILENTYTLGNNLIMEKMLKYYEIYKDIPIISYKYYEEPNCYNIPGFSEYSSSSSYDIGWIELIDNNKTLYRVPASKLITPLNKDDTCSIGIYECAHTNYRDTKRTVMYEMYKKKFKLYVDIFFNIMIN